MGAKPLELNMECCLRLKSWIRENGIKQGDLAKGVDYSRTYFNYVVNGKKRLAYELALRIEEWSQQKPDISIKEGPPHKYWKPNYYKDVCPVSRFWLLGDSNDEIIQQIDKLTKCIQKLRVENKTLKRQLEEIKKYVLGG